MKQIRNRSKRVETEAGKTLTEASNKPRKSAKKIAEKGQVTSSNLFSVQVAGLGQKSVSWGSGRTFWADKCDLQIRLSRRQISEKFVVSAAADVCHLRNKARNTRKLKIWLFKGFRGENHHKNRKKKMEEKP